MPPKHARNAITTFRRLPKELFRVNHGWQVNLRPKRNPDFAYDIVTAETDAAIESGGVRADVKEAGLYRSHTVLPRALQPGNYKPPNGAAVRPNTDYLRYYVANAFKGKEVIVYAIQEGTELPDDLILVHEGRGREEYSIQPAVPMTLEDLNRKITQFLQTSGAMMTPQQWSKAYPKQTEPRWSTYPLPKKWRIGAPPKAKTYLAQ